MIRVAIVDPHPAVRVGLEALLRGPADLVPVGAVATRQDLWPLLYRTDPDVVLIGDPRADRALRLCMQVRSRHLAIKAVIYAPAAGTEIAAAFAGAHAVVDPEAGMDELLRALRSPEPQRPPLTARMRRRAAANLPPVDRAILAMTLAGTSAGDIAQTVGLDRASLARRRAAILDGSAAAAGALDHPRELHA
jgi:DNA-binding NarL/FixJ family response regulator